MSLAKNRYNTYVALIALAAACLSCTFIKDKLAGNRNPLAQPIKVREVQPFDPAAPPVSPGAIVVRRLAEMDPSLVGVAERFEAAERNVISQTIAEKRPQSTPSQPAQTSSVSLPAGPNKTLPTAMLFAADAATVRQERVDKVALIGALITGLKGLFTGEQTRDSGPGGKSTKTETKDGTTTTSGMELTFKEDGTSAFAIEVNSDSEKDGKRVATQFNGRIEGSDCPDASGWVKLKGNFRLGGEAGGFGYTQEVQVDIYAMVNDNADIIERRFDIVQGVREVNGGTGMYVETGFTLEARGDKVAAWEMSNWREIRHSQSAASDLVSAKEALQTGQDAAAALATSILSMTESKWQNGGCVKIDAKSPGKVDPSSTTAIPVRVVHKFDGADVPSKLDATLSGASSIDPASIPKTAGTITYVAPGEKGQKATIQLKASSKRGRATLDLHASTGGFWTVNAQSNGVTFTGTICGTDKPFTLDATFPGGTSVMTFNPGGSMSSSGGGSGCTQTGTGNYNLLLNPDDSGTLDWSSSDTVKCPMGFSNSRSNKFSVKLEPAAEGKCN